MTKLFYAATPAGNKALLMLEELGLNYSMLPVNVFKGIQRTEDYKSIIPTGKIPAIIEDKKAIFETGAILVTLAQKHNKLIPQNNKEEALSWFFWENSELSPKFLQHYRAKTQNKENTEMHSIIEGQLKNLLGALNTQLEGKEYIANDFSIADISAYCWLKNYLVKDAIPNLIDGLSNIQAWVLRMDNRDATKKMDKIAGEFSWEKETTVEEIMSFYNA